MKKKNRSEGTITKTKKRLSHLLLIIVLSCSSLHYASNQSSIITQSNESCSLRSEKFSWNRARPPKLVFLSIDSLNSALLDEYLLKLRTPHPFGLKMILSHSNVNKMLKIQNPTITASSHTSTITCSGPANHGIFANTQWNGEKLVNGFSLPTKTESFATSIDKSGLKVVTAGYPTIDNSEPGRTVREGFSYGEISGDSLLKMLENGDKVEHLWKNKKQEELAKILVNLNTDGQISVKCSPRQCAVKTVDENRTDLLVELDEKRASAFILKFDKQIYISPLGTNLSFPQKNSSALDSCGIIFSPGKDYKLIPAGTNFMIQSLNHRFDFFKNAWMFYLPNTNADAIFMYLEDLDALRHQYSGDQSATDAVLNHLEKVDSLVGSFLQSLPVETNVVVMGDHGMSTIWRELNVRKILTEKVLRESLIVTSGGTLMLYKKGTTDNLPPISAPSSEDKIWLNEARDSLKKFRLNDFSDPIFEKIYTKGSDEMKDARLDHANAPFLIAFANEKFALQDSTSNDLILANVGRSDLPPPRSRGQHGHNNENTTMKALLAMWGPELSKVNAAQININTEVVPAIARALRWPLPKQCQN